MAETIRIDAAPGTLIATGRGVSSAGLQILTLKQYVMLSGVDYPSDHNNQLLSGGFNDFALKRMKKIEATKKPNDYMIFYNFNIFGGKMTKRELKGNDSPKETIINYDPVTQANFIFESNGTQSRMPFKPNGKKNIISKITVYELIEKIGVDNPNSLNEFSIFSHSHAGGPILLGSWELEMDGTINTDDYDMRAGDFTKIINKVNFKNAFFKDGFIKIWGCQFSRILNAFFNKAFKNKNYTNAVAEDTVFDFKANTLFFYPPTVGQPTYDLLAYLINPILSTTFKVTDKVSLTFLQIKKIASQQFLSSFASKVFESIDVKVISALPASYSSYKNNEYRISEDTYPNVNFYKNHLGVIVEEHYGIHDRAILDSITIIKNK
jgi:hypothetical protein